MCEPDICSCKVRLEGGFLEAQTRARPMTVVREKLMNHIENPKPSGISRRTVAKGIAWSVPAVAVATAVPAYAVSPIPPISFDGTGCKDPSGGQGARYYFVLSIDNNNIPPGTPIPFEYTFSESENFTHNGQQPGTFTPDVINATEGDRILIRFNSTENAANGTLTISYWLNEQHYTIISASEYSSDCQNRGIVPF